MKRTVILLLSLMLIVSLAVGCSASKLTAKEIIIDGIDKNKDVQTMSIDGTVKLDIDLSQANITSQELMYLQMISGIEFSYTGKQSIETKQMEIAVQARANFQEFDFTFDIPIILKDDILYVKIPALLKTLFPDSPLTDDISKEFIAINLAEMAGEQKISQEQDQELAIQLVKDLINSLDDSIFVKEDKKEFTLTSGTVDNAVSIVVTQDNLQPLLENFMTNGLPIITGYLEQLAIDSAQKEQLQQFKDHLNNSSQELEQAIQEIPNLVTINTLRGTVVFDKKGFLRKGTFNADVIAHTETEGDIGITVSVEENIDNINSEVEFTMPTPTEEQIIDLTQLFNAQSPTY